MTLGASFFLIALGAVLKYAVTTQVSGIQLSTVGVILMVVGAVGLVVGLFLLTARRRTDVVHHEDGTTYVQPTDRVV